MEPPAPQQEHRWLQKLVGEWTYEHEVPASEHSPATKVTGTERIRAIGDLWIVAEGRGEMPGGGMATTLLTLGFDPAKGHFVGTWIGSMMPTLWTYEGRLEGDTLTLDSEGPSFSPEGGTARYREAIVLNGDERTFSSAVLGADGQWSTFMTATYRRTGSE